MVPCSERSHLWGEEERSAACAGPLPPQLPLGPQNCWAQPSSPARLRWHSPPEKWLQDSLLWAKPLPGLAGPGQRSSLCHRLGSQWKSHFPKFIPWVNILVPLDRQRLTANLSGRDLDWQDAKPEHGPRSRFKVMPVLITEDSAGLRRSCSRCRGKGSADPRRSSPHCCRHGQACLANCRDFLGGGGPRAGRW